MVFRDLIYFDQKLLYMYSELKKASRISEFHGILPYYGKGLFIPSDGILSLLRARYQCQNVKMP